MNAIALNLGKFTITWYAIFILSGVILAYIFILKESKRFNIPANFVSNLVFWCVIFGILGARIYYVIFNMGYYAQNPIEVVKIWNGGLAIHGGLIAGLLTLLIYCKKYKVSILKMTDIALPAVLLAQGIGRWGNFFNGEAHGALVSKAYLVAHHIPSFVIKGMKIAGHYYEPTFFYESCFCILGFIILIGFRAVKNTKLGNTTALYLIWYGIVRFIIEGMRTDSLMLGNIKMAQFISIIMIISGIAMFIITKLKNKRYEEVTFDENEIQY